MLIIITIIVQCSNRKDKEGVKVTEPKRNEEWPTQLLTIC